MIRSLIVGITIPNSEYHKQLKDNVTEAKEEEVKLKVQDIHDINTQEKPKLLNLLLRYIFVFNNRPGRQKLFVHEIKVKGQWHYQS